MTAITLATLRTRARQLGDYENSTVFTDAVMTPWVNEAIGDYFDLLDEHFDGYRDTTGTVTTTASVATVALPAAFLKARAIDILDGGTYRQLRRFQPGPQALGFDQATGRPVGYLHVGTNLELFPTPDAAYTIRLRYVPAMTALSADGDSIDVPNGWEGFIVHSILLRCDEREERPLGDRLAAIDRYRARIVRASQNRNTAEPAYLPMPWEGSTWPG